MPKPTLASASSTAVMQTLQWMRKHSFRPVPLHYQSKAAIFREYASANYRSPDDELWRKNNYGVGCVTGPAHSGPVDVDNDCAEARFFSSVFLPQTAAVFGRKTNPDSHYLYRVDSPTLEKQAFLDPMATTKQTIIEIRGDGGHQTAMPGSVHESTGELVEWSKLAFPEVPVVATDVLLKAVRKVAVATLISRYLWVEGSRNEMTKHLTGTFFYLEWSLEDVEQLLQAVMEYCDDDDKSRLPTIRNTYKRGEAGKKISGSGVLRKIIKNDALIDRLMDWAGSPTVVLMTEYNSRFGAVMLRGKFRIADTEVPPSEPVVFCQKEDFLNAMSTDHSDLTTTQGNPISKARLWINNKQRRNYRGADFMPGIEESSHILNLWTGWAVRPQLGCCDAWLELARDVICGGDEHLFDWLMQWFANILREPQNKSLTALVIIGVEGAGKSLMLDYFGSILGYCYRTVTKDDHIHGRFNSHLGNVLLLHSAEALYAGDKKHAGIIRSLITDKTTMLENKGIDPIEVRNYLRIALTSNDIYAAPAKPGDRRYTVIDMGQRKLSNDLKDRVLEELNSDGPAALFNYLLEMEYDAETARTNVKNESLLDLKRANMSPVENWWYNTLMSGQILPDYLAWCTRPEKEDWPQTVSSVALYKSLMIKLRESNQTRQTVTDALFMQLLRKFLGGMVLHKGQRNYDDPLLDRAPPEARNLNERQWSIVNVPPLDECREKFEQYLGQEIDWSDIDDATRSTVEKEEHDRY